MLIPNHPDEERLAALAGGDPEATGDTRLRSHVADCLHCAGILADLTSLRAAMAQLPDLAPPRPIELRLPASRPTWRDRLAAFSQRAFAPAMGLATAFLVVGVVGIGGLGHQAAGPPPEPGSEAAPDAPAPAADEQEAEYFVETADPDRDGTLSEPGVASEPGDRSAAPDFATERGRELERVLATAEEGWPWSGMLVAGLLLMVLAVALRLALRPARR